jgi:hypothetical protein
MRKHKPGCQNFMEDEPDSRACRFLTLHEALPAPGSVKIPSPPPTPTSDFFLKDVKRIYQKTPSAYKGKPTDQAMELVQTRIVAKILDELRLLTSALKSKPTV